MLKDITIGQYFPQNSVLHSLDPRMKIIAVTIFIVMLFIPNNAFGLSVGIFVSLLGYAISKIPIRMAVKSIKPIIPIIIFTSILNMIFVDGTVLFSFWFFKVTYEGIRMAAFMIVRIICLISGSSLLTYTTSPIALTDALERLLSPLKRVKMPVHELSMMMTIALRFIPTLIEETDKIMSAQKARGADMESGGIIDRAKALIPVLIPLFVSSFRRADDLALAMECRCYHGDEGRTRMKSLQYSRKDFICLAFMLLFLGLTIGLNFVFPSIY